MRKFSIRTAVLSPIILLLMVMMISFTLIMSKSYNEISYEYANKVINSMSENIKNKVTTILDEPMFVSQVYANLIMDQKLYAYNDFKEVEKTALSLTKQVHTALPQITTLGYGDENKNFVGIRSNEDDTYTLMVKDNLTGGLLNIYEGESRDTAIIDSYSEYDPRTRPWYQPVLDNQIPQWSDIYVNQDEIRSATISSLVPIFNANRTFEGVVCIDVNLSSINTYLRNLAKEIEGLIYIVDQEGRVISHSSQEPIYVEDSDSA